MSRVRNRVLAGARRRLPTGGTLPAAEFERRHAALCRVLWVSAIALPVFSFAIAHYSLLHDLAHALPVIPLAYLAGRPTLKPRERSIACALGLLTVAALGVHISGGTIEAHFAFFVVIVMLTVYEDWWPFLIAVAYVFIHHGVFGMIDPKAVWGSHHHHPWLWAGIHAVFVACAGIAAVTAWRFNEAVRERMREAQRQLVEAALTDSLTGLGNRRRLLSDLDDAIETASPYAPVTFAIFDLDGFKNYNDVFGHVAGDTLLERLGHVLAAAVAPAGRAYRLGGDEFCVIMPGAEGTGETVVRAGLDALAVEGPGFAVSASYGEVAIPREAVTGSDALRVADRRMYQRKLGGRRTAGAQSTDVLLRALSERHAALGNRHERLAALAVETAMALGCSSEDVEQIGHAAELHDIGKLALPSSILTKTGPLDEEEWEFVRRHTLVGERIIAGAPALATAARLVRSTHERWDGTGYPDGLARTEIPLGSRIIAVCDALDAMRSARAYRRARTMPEAARELRLGAGTQFDPDVVDAVLASAYAASSTRVERSHASAISS
jgi:diguanylate cyclase (GGDEF)-like protein